MKLYKTKTGITVEKDNSYYHIPGIDWEEFLNEDHLFDRMEALRIGAARSAAPPADVLPPIGSHQELWACGVTYLKSKIGRQEESKASGGSDFYATVYDAVRPEVFFKSTPHRVVGHLDKVKIRKDSTWDVPEPELTLVVNPAGMIVGYTIGNDMSSRSIEGENPLYLPQAKTYDACAAVGPCIYVSAEPLQDAAISLIIKRNGTIVFEGTTNITQMKRTAKELVSFVYRECSFPYGCLVMTGTGIVPGHDFTLAQGDEISISIEHIGTLINTVQ